MNKHSIFAVVFVSLVTLTLNSCFLDRSGGGVSTPTGPQRVGTPIGTEGVANSWSASAFPGYACPADNITFEWNVGDPMCPTGTGPSCQTLTVMDNLLVLAPFTSRNLIGSQSYGSISSIDSWSGANPVLTFSVTHDDPSDPGWRNISSEVQIVQNPPAPPMAQTFTATSVCNPISGRWDLTDFRLDMDSPSFIQSTRGLGACVRITSVCYMPRPGSGSLSYDPIIVSLVGGGPMATSTIARGGCVDGLNLRPNLHYQVIPDPSTPLIETMGGPCIEGIADDPTVEPPFIELQFTLRCDTNLPECGN